MPLGVEVGLGPGNIVLGGERGTPLQFSAHVYVVVKRRMPLGTEVGLGPGNIVLDANPTPPPKKGLNSPHFSAHDYCSQTVAHLSNC